MNIKMYNINHYFKKLRHFFITNFFMERHDWSDKSVFYYHYHLENFSILKSFINVL